VGGVIEVSGEAVGVVIVAVGVSAFFIILRKFRAILSNIGLITVGTGEFVCS
jgi:hypothetical protein